MPESNRPEGTSEQAIGPVTPFRRDGPLRMTQNLRPMVAFRATR